MSLSAASSQAKPTWDFLRGSAALARIARGRPPKPRPPRTPLLDNAEYYLGSQRSARRDPYEGFAENYL
jgi:hypothetical protein